VSKKILQGPPKLLNRQESLADAKVSPRQQCVWRPLAKKSTAANQRKEHNVQKYIQWVATLSLTVWVLSSFV